MKTFQEFKEAADTIQSSMKDFAYSMMPQMKKFAKSDEVKNMKKDVTNLFLTKGQDLLNAGQKKIASIKRYLENNEKKSENVNKKINIQYIATVLFTICIIMFISRSVLLSLGFYN